MINYCNRNFELLKLFFSSLSVFLPSKQTIIPLNKFRGNSLYAIANFINPLIPYVPLSYKIKHIYESWIRHHKTSYPICAIELQN
jgi:hypothetical protein